MPRFEEFDRPKLSSQTTRPTISIRVGGTFGVNKAAYEASGRPRAVKLLWDEEERAIGFRPSHENSPKAYPVNKTKPKGGYDVAAAAFLKHYGIANDRCRRYVAEMEDGDLVIYLDRDEKKPTEGV